MNPFRPLNIFVKESILLVGSVASFFSRKCLRIPRLPFIISAVFVAGAWVSPRLAFSQEETALEELKEKAVNFHEAAPGVYRSGLISEEASPYLKELGIKTVVSFDNNKHRAKAEEERLRRLGIDLIPIPWSGWDYPDDEVISKVIELIESPERRPILVHCKHGQERTGVVIASWRIAKQGWQAEKAYQEMKAHGFRPFQYGHLKEYVYDFARRHGHEDAKIENKWERTKTQILSFLYQMRKANPFL
ncbi:MAG: dual specificity protein phosphatase family protein [Candidatus Omnitrophica bacterium]|nr:dual specificity protein phosphatase family protein [Candidatus Omnitrophota bacterium]